MKTKTEIKILRHASLEENVMNAYIKFHYWEANFQRDIHVQKIKVKKSI